METLTLPPGIHGFRIEKPVLAGNTTQRKHVFNRSATTISSGGFRAFRAGGRGVAIILFMSNLWVLNKFYANSYLSPRDP